MFSFLHELFNEVGAVFDAIGDFVLDSPILTLLVLLFPILLYIVLCRIQRWRFDKKLGDFLSSLDEEE